MVTRILFFICFFSTSMSGFADHVIWSGKVNSDGTPTHPVGLSLHKKYKIKVSGVVNTQKWVQAGDHLANDACFEFGSKDHQKKVITLRNSNDISVCDGNYHPDHVYQSLPFSGMQNKIHFWVHDIDYEDNSGAFDVEISEIQ